MAGEVFDLTGDLKFDYDMPPTQYLGSKSKLLGWIVAHTPRGASLFDAFAGSNVVAYEFKKTGKKIITNDYLNFSHLTALAVIQNNHVHLTHEDIARLLVANPRHDDFIERNYTNLLYTKKECQFLDNLHANITSFEDKYKRALAFAAICRACIRKMPMGKFRSNMLQYRQKGSPHYRPKFVKSIQNTFLEFLRGYDAAVFDNGQNNVSHVGNTPDVIKKVEADIAYFDPPYCGSGFHYESDYFFLELYTKYYGRDIELTGKVKKYKGMQESGFDRPNKIKATLEKLFRNAAHIPVWIISYNNRSPPGLDEMLELLAKYRNPKVIEKEYKYKFVGNGGLKEYLFVCD